MQANQPLPAVVARYFAADTLDATAVTECFTEDAVVADESREHRGRAAIAAWKAASTAKYAYTVEVLDGAVRDDEVIVTGKVTGTFPGSPVVLRYRFDLQGEQIRRLQIG